MKSKYLLGSLLGGLLLAACTADDALDTKVAVQETNPYAPVFSVSFDGNNDAETRAWVDPEDGWKLKFEVKTDANGNVIGRDLLSLYHGIKSPATALEGYGNAIYASTDGSGAEGLAFTTQAMVAEGGAIMVWPADTLAKNNGDNAPKLRITLEQDEDTWVKTPYMSELLDIKAYGSGYDGIYSGTNSGNYVYNKDITEGYARQYPIMLKRVGSTLSLETERKSEKSLAGVKRLDNVTPVPGVIIQKVEISVDENSTTLPFTEAIPVKVTGLDPKFYGVPLTGGNVKERTMRALWKEQTEADVTNINAADRKSAISTKHIENAESVGGKTTAYFTLLPTDATNLAANNHYSGAKVKLSTYYGYVEVSGDELGRVSADEKTNTFPAAYDTKKAVWADAAGNKYSVRGGLDQFLSGMYSENTLNSSVFKGELYGHLGKRTLQVDMSQLKMDGLHIKDEMQLQDVMCAYETLTKEGSITLYLDGGKNGNAQGEFYMSKPTWTRVVTEMTKGKLKFVPCQTSNEVCNYIRLQSGATSEETAVEVPTLKFEKDGILDGVTVRLDEGYWKYYEGVVNSKTKELTGVKNLEVVAGAKLELKNEVKAESKLNDDLTIVVAEKTANKAAGLVNVKSDVRVGVNVINKGKVEISGNSSLIMNNTKTFTNESGKPTDYENGNVLLEYGGLLYNNGRLGIEDLSGAKINNYGTIKAMSEKARTYISTNSLNTDGANALGAKYNATTNKIGTIILHEKTGGDNNTRVSDENRQGFIKLQVSAENANGTHFGGVANYIVLGEGVKTYTDAKNVEYVEINVEANEEVKFVNEIGEDGKPIPTELTGLFVNPTRNANVPDGVEVKVAVKTYLPGKVWKAGTFVPGTKGTTNSEYVSYFGGNTDHYKNVTVY